MYTLFPCSFSIRSIVILLAGMMVFASASYGQDVGPELRQEEPFSTLRIGASSGIVFRNSGIPEWSPGPDVRLNIDTPFAGGRLRLGGAFREWEGQHNVDDLVDYEGTVHSGDLLDVQTLDILAGWGLANRPEAPISLDAGLMIGNRFMFFDLPKESPGRLESEMLAGPWVRIGRIAGPVRLFAEVRALRVLTQPRWDTIGISGGVAFEFGTPGWIQWILK